jgi:hypothetical protein
MLPHEMKAHAKAIIHVLAFIAFPDLARLFRLDRLRPNSRTMEKPA